MCCVHLWSEMEVSQLTHAYDKANGHLAESDSLNLKTPCSGVRTEDACCMLRSVFSMELQVSPDIRWESSDPNHM